MNFTTPSKVLAAITSGDYVELNRSINRTKILDAANNCPPLSEDDAKKMCVKINCNWGELAVLLTHAVAQLLGAFTANQYYFTVSLPRAPKEHQSEWGAFITQEINRCLNESLEYYLLHVARWSSVAKHGIAPMIWTHDDRWLPRFRALSDIRVPTDTELSFRNLNWFADRISYTTLELLDEAFNSNPNNFWNKKAVAQILKNYKELNVTSPTNNYNWDTDYEKLAGVIKQDGTLGGSDALPTIPLWHFYFKDDDGMGGSQWYMRVVPETGAAKGAAEDEFLWQSKVPVARKWNELIHCQYGDLSFDDPPTFHAVRGLGFMLLEPTFYRNLTMCRGLQHLHDNMNILLRITDPPDKARAAIQEFNNMGIVRSGVSFVTQDERHQIAAGLYDSMMAGLKQLQGEASSSYTQQADTGTQKEQTAFETRVKAEQVNAMTAGIVLRAAKYEAGADREICRRFCLPKSDDPDIIEFQARCRAMGIPRGWLDVKQWVVEPMTPIGMGNPTIAQAAIQQLMALRPMMNPTAQNEVLHEAVLTITKDARKAARWAPISGQSTQSDAKREAQGMFGTLMTGVPVPLSESNPIDQIDALLPLFAGKIVQVTKRDNMATPDEATGLSNVSTYIGQAIAKLAQDPLQKDKVKQYTDSLAKLGNEMKALIQRGEAARKAQQDKQNGAEQMQVQSKIRNDNLLTQNKLRNSQLEEQRKDRALQAELARKKLETEMSVAHEGFKALAGAHHQRLKSAQVDES